MNVYKEYDDYRRQPDSRPEDFMRTALARAGYPAEEIDSLVAAMADTIESATKNLRAVMRSPAPAPTMTDIIIDALKGLKSAVMADERLKDDEKRTFLERIFGWLTGSSWRQTRGMTEKMAAYGDEPNDAAAPQDWDAFDPADAAMPEDKEGRLAADIAIEEVGEYLADATYNRNVLAFGCSATEIGRTMEDETSAEGAVPQVVVEALNSDLLSDEEGEFKKIAALDYFLRLADAEPAATEGDRRDTKQGLQLLAVKAAHDAFLQANDFKASFKRLRHQAMESLADNGSGKEEDHV